MPGFPGFGAGGQIGEFKSNSSDGDGAAGGKFPGFEAGQVVEEKTKAKIVTKESGVVKPGLG